MDEIIQLKVTLDGSNPPIWRRVLVKKKTDFYDLHFYIQRLMGWHNSHPYKYCIGNMVIGEFDMFMPPGKGPFLNSWEVKLDSVIKKPGEKFTYVYDFGDYYIHNIEVEKFLPLDINMQYPKCIDGQLNAPYEDCGGIVAHYHLLKVLADKDHPEYEHWSDWAEEGFDIYDFDIDLINSKL